MKVKRKHGRFFRGKRIATPRDGRQWTWTPSSKSIVTFKTGFSAVLWAGQSFVQILPILSVLVGITAVVMSIAIWRFNRGKIR